MLTNKGQTAKIIVILDKGGKNMAKTKRVRVYPKEYEMISELSEKEDITYAEAVHRLIRGNCIIKDGEVEEIGQAGGIGGKLFWGAVATAGAVVAKEFMGDSEEEKEEEG